MSIFVLVFGLFLLGVCAVVSSPVPGTWGKRASLFIVGIAFWAGVFILVRMNQESLVDFLTTDYALTGPFGAQMAATMFVFGMGWFVFVVSSFRMERKRMTQFEQYWQSAEQPKESVKVFRPWPGILVWIPIMVVLAAIWIVPVQLAGADLKPTAVPTATVTATNTPTATSTAWPTPTVMPTNTPTAIPTAAPTATVEATQTPDPSKPALACEGTWLHQEPIAVGNIRTFFELCADGYRFAAHEIDIGWDPIPSEFMTVMPGGGARLEFQMNGGELLVNGQPFNEWLAARGGK